MYNIVIGRLPFFFRAWLLCGGLVVFFFLGIFPDAGNCYFIDHASDGSLLIRPNAPPSKEQRNFTIQDNLQLFSKTDRSAPLLLPVSEFFVSPDIINANLPIFSLFRQPATFSQDPFADTLYANLRVRKLLEEYAEMQKRAEALIGTVNASGERIDWELPEPTESPADGNSQQEDLHNALKKLRQNLAQLGATGSIATRSRGQKGAGNGSAAAGARKAAIVSFAELETVVKQVSTSFQEPLGGGTPGYSAGAESQYQLPAAGSKTGGSAEKSIASSTYQGEINLPWILDLPFKLMDYAMNHKVLSLVIGFFILMLLNIFFGSRS